MSEIDLIKGGETIIRAGFQRTLSGIKITVKAIPTVEEFFKYCGTGDILPVATVGHRYWIPQNNQVLNVYDIPPSMVSAFPEGLLQHCGYPITGDGGCFNLSILRLVGISEGNGVTFTIKGVMSDKQITNVGNLFSSASKQFYRTFLRPTGVFVNVHTSIEQFSPGQVSNMSD